MKNETVVEGSAFGNLTLEAIKEATKNLTNKRRNIIFVQSDDFIPEDTHCIVWLRKEDMPEKKT